MPIVLHDHVRSSPTDPRYPVTDLIRTYLEQAGSKFDGLRDARRERAEPATAEELWDYLGDFA